MKGKPTLTIGIPMFNEEQNIGQLLASLVSQTSNTYTLERILVVDDTSTDSSVDIVEQYQKRFPIIHMIHNTSRQGKSFGLNNIHQHNISEYLFIIDADVLPATRSFLDSFLTEALRYDTDVTAADHIPAQITSNAFVDVVFHHNYCMWSALRRGIHGGNNIYNLYGSATLIKGSFAKTIQYPHKFICDEGYLYLKTQKSGSFHFAQSAKVLQKPVSSWHDFRQFNSRSSESRKPLISLFGNKAISAYHIPLSNKIRTLLKFLATYPVLTTFAVCFNLVSQLFPLSDSLLEHGYWQRLQTTKMPLEKGAL